LSIGIGAETAARVNWSRLETEIGSATPHVEGEQTILEFDFAAVPALEIHPSYVQGLLGVLAQVRHEQPLPGTAVGDLVSVSEEVVTLTAVVERRRRAVVQAAFQGAATATQRGLLEALCRAMEKKPIQECADHALIAVERGLRDPAAAPPVAGLVTPDNADPAFALPQRLVRALLAEYRRQTGYTDTANFFDRPVSAHWAQLTLEQRQSALQDALRAEEGGRHLELVGLDGPKRVVVRFTAELDSNARQEILARLETRLRQTVEPALHITTQVKADTNILRTADKKKLP
jgi:hypothetical protein